MDVAISLQHEPLHPSSQLMAPPGSTLPRRWDLQCSIFVSDLPLAPAAPMSPIQQRIENFASDIIQAAQPSSAKKSRKISLPKVRCVEDWVPLETAPEEEERSRLLIVFSTMGPLAAQLGVVGLMVRI